MDKTINIVYCEDESEYKEMISLLCQRYKDTKDFYHREISDTIITNDKKWIVAYSTQMQILVKNAKKPVKSWNASTVKDALCKEGIVNFPLYKLI